MHFFIIYSENKIFQGLQYTLYLNLLVIRLIVTGGDHHSKECVVVDGPGVT